MHFVALALGVVTGVAGLVLIGLSLPIDLAYLGNTLIVIGTIGTVGGLILVGVASVIRQLRRIAQALEARPLRSLTSEPADSSPRVASPLRAPNGTSDSRFEPMPEQPTAPPAMAPEPMAPPPMPPALMPPASMPAASMMIEDAAPPAAIEAAIEPSPA
jgi:hypothetical protein